MFYIIEKLIVESGGKSFYRSPLNIPLLIDLRITFNEPLRLQQPFANNTSRMQSERTIDSDSLS